MKEVDIGLAADIGSLAYLPKITGNQSFVRELAYTGRNFSAPEAEKLGLVSRIVPGGRDEVVQAALELAKVIAAKSPIAVSGTKRLVSHARDHSVEENLVYTRSWNAHALMTNVSYRSESAANLHGFDHVLGYEGKHCCDGGTKGAEVCQTEGFPKALSLCIASLKRKYSFFFV